MCMRICVYAVYVHVHLFHVFLHVTLIEICVCSHGASPSEQRNQAFPMSPSPAVRPRTNMRYVSIFGSLQ